MKYELPKQILLKKKDERAIKKYLSKIKTWFMFGVLHGLLILGGVLLYKFLR